MRQMVRWRNRTIMTEPTSTGQSGPVDTDDDVYLDGDVASCARACV